MCLEGRSLCNPEINSPSGDYRSKEHKCDRKAEGTRSKSL